MKKIFILFNLLFTAMLAVANDNLDFTNNWGNSVTLTVKQAGQAAAGIAALSDWDRQTLREAYTLTLLGSVTEADMDAIVKAAPALTLIDAEGLTPVAKSLERFFAKHAKAGARPPDGEDLFAHFIDAYGDKNRARSCVANYDNIENLIAQKADFTAVNFGIAQLRQEENPKSPISSGQSYIEAQIHGPVLLSEDVEEIRIDTFEMEEHFEKLFEKLPAGEQAALDREEWVNARVGEAKAEILADTKKAPFKVTFYDAMDTRDVEESLFCEVAQTQEKTSISQMKEKLVALGNSFLGERRAELMARIAMNMTSSSLDSARAFFGGNFANLPDWVVAEAERLMREWIDKEFGINAAIRSEDDVKQTIARAFTDLFVRFDEALQEMDVLHIDDPVRRENLLKEIVRLRVKKDHLALATVRLDAISARALGDLDAFVRETFEKDIEGGRQLMEWAFAGLPTVSGAAADAIRQRIMNEIREIQSEISRGNLPSVDSSMESLAKHIRQKAIKPFMEKKAMIMRQQTFFAFPSVEERNAFLSWAISAGKLKNEAQFEGAYEASTKLTDAFEAKIKSGAPLTAQDIVDCYKAFAKTAMEWMVEDGKAQGVLDYGADDRANFFDRIASVALSRLAARLGNDAVGKIAAALDTPDGRWLYHAVVAAQDADPGKIEETDFGTAETAASFLNTLVRRIPGKFGFPIHMGDWNVGVNYAAVPPFARALVEQISPKAAETLKKSEPYDISNAGARFLTGVPAPVNPGAMPQNKAQRKAFLLDMLPTYHAHEMDSKFDRGVNHHGRTHATRTFVLSIAMGNILKEKGVKVDMNAVALATAGHDTGRRRNGAEQAGSEARSADIVNAGVENRYPGAAGDAWKEQVKENITTPSAGQTTVEGYLFKCADSLDYWRVDDLDENRFPFLKTPILTADGIVVDQNRTLRRQLMAEAKRLTMLTQPRYQYKDEHNQLLLELSDLPDGPEFNAKNARHQQLGNLMQEGEIRQSETKSDEQIVELVESAIRDNPQDFPLLTKYYLNAE